MLLGMTQVVFEGVPTYPDAGRAWAITDKYKVPCPVLPALPCPALHHNGCQHMHCYIQTCIMTKKEVLASDLAFLITMLYKHKQRDWPGHVKGHIADCSQAFPFLSRLMSACTTLR